MNLLPIRMVRSLAFYLVFYIATVPIVLAMLIARLVSRATLMALARNWASLHRWCLRWLVGIRVQVHGEAPHGPVLVAVRHESFFEAIDMLRFFENPVGFAKAGLLRIPLWGVVARDYGLVPVERDQGAKALRAMLTAARKGADEGRPLVIFPEGTRVPHGTSPVLKSGFAGMYKLIGLPVVPVAVNSGPLYHRWWKRSGTVTYRVGEAIPPGLPRDEIEARVRAAIAALNTQE